MEIPIDKLRNIYFKMVLTRLFDMKINDMIKRGISISNNSGIGQEATPIAACAVLRPDDYVMPYHRGWGWTIGKGMEPKYMLAELMGKRTGYMGGRGGARLADWDLRVWGRVGLQAAHVPLAAGVGLSIKMRQGTQVVLCPFGDGPPNIGVWHEGMNLAAIWEVPVVFVCENNGYAESTPREHTMRNEYISERAASYRIPGITIDGNDIFAVFETIQAAVDRARSGEGPTLIETLTYRWLGHFSGDLEYYGGYRSKEEVNAWKEKCPIKRARKKMIQMEFLKESEIAAIEGEAQSLVEQAEHFAKESPYPTREELISGVFPD